MMNFVVEAGGIFECVFTPPDAGTFWFGPLLNASLMRDMGFSGMLIVEEVPSPAEFVDVPLIFDDWVLGDDGKIVGGFGSLETAIGEGRLGNWFTVNGAFKPRLAIDRAKPTRLRLLNAANIRIERIVSHGHASPEGFWYDQDEHEWVIVLKGAARLQFEYSNVDMKPGDFVKIPAHKKHRVEWTMPNEPTIWLMVHY